jgi:hypothetical protein
VHVPEERACGVGLPHERPVVVPGDDQLVSVREPPNEVDRALELGQVTAATEIARVHEHVAIRDDQLVVIEVRVGNGDDARHAVA